MNHWKTAQSMALKMAPRSSALHKHLIDGLLFLRAFMTQAIVY
ncbi:MAG: hypothetical protein SFV81_17510 [Pirellulaceae bacterium]|nr:hypothetical protein [Pirellulaceae bacterium]